MHLAAGAGHSLRAELAAANDPAPTMAIHYHDLASDGTKTYGTALATLADAVAEVLGEPNDPATRIVDGISIYNADNAGATVSLYLYDGSADWDLMEVTMATLETSTWTPAAGWQHFSVTGQLKGIDT